MKIALFFIEFHPYGHTRRLVEEALRVFTEREFCFFINAGGSGFIEPDLLDRKEVFFFHNVADGIKEIASRKDIDALVLFDTYDNEVARFLDSVPLGQRRVVIYNPSANTVLHVRNLASLVSKGFILLWEHELVCYIFNKYVYSKGLCGLLPFPIPLFEYDPVEQSYDLLFPGSFEERKGASVFLYILPRMLDKSLKIRASLMGHERFVAELAKYRGKVSLREGFDRSQEDFLKEVVSSRVAFLAYDPYEHSFSGSGILRECMFYGTPVIATQGSWLSYYLERNEGGWLPLENRMDEDVVLKTVEEALYSYDTLKEKALSAMDRVRSESSSLMFKRKILDAIDGMVDEPDFGKLPQDLLRKAESYLWFMKANLAYRRGDKEEAERLLDESFSFDKRYWRALFLKADLLMERGEYEEAINLIESVDCNPLISPANKAMVLIKKAQIFDRMGKISYCIKSFEELKPLTAFVPSRYIEDILKIPLAKDTGVIQKLFLETSDYLKIFNNKAYRIRFLLEMIYMGAVLNVPLDSHMEALLEEIDSLSSEENILLSEIESLRVRAIFNDFCLLLIRKGEMGLVRVLIDCFVRLIQKLNIKDPVYFYNIASLYEKVEELDKAEELFTYLLNREFHNKPGIYFHLGEIALKRGDKKKALDYYSRCLQEESDHSLARRRLMELGGV